MVTAILQLIKAMYQAAGIRGKILFIIVILFAISRYIRHYFPSVWEDFIDYIRSFF